MFMEAIPHDQYSIYIFRLSNGDYAWLIMPEFVPFDVDLVLDSGITSGNFAYGDAIKNARRAIQLLNE